MSTFSPRNFKENRDAIFAKITEVIPASSTILSKTNKDSFDEFNQIYDGLTKDVPNWYGKQKLEGTTKLINDLCGGFFREFISLIGRIALERSKRVVNHVVVFPSVPLPELEAKFGLKLPTDFPNENIYYQNLSIESSQNKKEFRQLLVVQDVHQGIITEIERVQYERANFYALILTTDPVFPDQIIKNTERQTTPAEQRKEENKPNTMQQTEYGKIWVNRMVKMKIPTVDTFGDVIDAVLSWIHNVEISDDKDVADWIEEGNKLAEIPEIHNYEDALSKYDSALEIDNDSVEALYRKGLVFFKQKNYQDALKCYDKALEINSTRLDVLYAKGLLFDELKNYQEALKIFDKALEIDPGKYDILYHKGLDLLNLERYDAAREAFDKCIATNSTDSYRAWYQKGIAFFKEKNYEDALKCYDKALEIQHDYPEALYDKGLTLNILERYQEAVKCFDEVVKMSPKFGDAFYNRAISHVGKNNVRNALGDLKKAIEIGTTDDNDFFLKKAREDKNFEKLGEDKRFRELVGLASPTGNQRQISAAPIVIDKDVSRSPDESMKDKVLKSGYDNLKEFLEGFDESIRELEKSVFAGDPPYVIWGKVDNYRTLSGILYFMLNNRHGLELDDEVINKIKSYLIDIPTLEKFNEPSLQKEVKQTYLDVTSFLRSVSKRWNINNER